MTTLIIAAHPDDEVLGAGGTIPILVQQGEVHILILGEGISSRYHKRNMVKRKELLRLQDCARSAASVLGASTVRFCNLQDNRFDQIALLDIVKQIEAQIEEINPYKIYTHHPGDLNIDHGITFRAVLTASRPVNDRPVKEIYAFEIPSSTDWAFKLLKPDFKPNVFIDISKTFDSKIKAMKIYESEGRQFPHPRSEEALRATAMRWGSVAGIHAAEAFELVRSIIY